MKRSDTQALFFALAILCICVHFVHQCQCFTKPIQMGETAPLQPSKYFVADSVHVFYYKDPQTRLHYESTPWTTEERDALIKIVDERDVPIDWSEVASQMGSKKPMDCFIQYDNVDNPANNKGQWSFDEDKKIAELVTKFDEHEWCNIAEELSTNRTPYECLRHYQQHMNTKLINSNEWTAEEDEMLKSAVEQYGLGQWQAVSSCIPGRSSIQCMSRWKKASCHDNLVNGKWLPEEEKLLFLAALSYGAPRMSDSKKSEVELQSLFSKAGIAFDGTESLPMQNGEQVATTNAIFTRWLDIAALVPGKNEVQCREKWSNSLDPSVNADAYSAEEDNRLIAVTYALQHQLQQWQQQREHQEGQTAASSLTGAAPSSSGATTAASSSSSSSSNPSSSSSSTANPATTGTIHTPATSSTSPPPPVAAAEGAHRVMRYGVNEELMRGIDTSSVRWARVAEYLPGRTDASVRSRYNQILKELQRKSSQPAAAGGESAAESGRLCGTKRARSGRAKK